MVEGVFRYNISGDEATQPAIRTLRARDDRQRQTKEGLKVQEAIFYVDDGMVATTDLGWLHTVFDTLTGLFGRMGLKKNVRKTVGMVCHPCQADGVQVNEAYTRRMTGAGGGGTRRDSGSGSAALSAGRTWRGVHWLHTSKPSMEWRRGIWDRRVMEKVGSKIPGLTGWRFR